MVGVVTTRTRCLLSAEAQAAPCPRTAGRAVGVRPWAPHPPSSVAHSVAVFVGSECESLRLDAEPGVLADSVLTASPIFGVIHGDQH